jgi:AraC-like DNA-binding protein
MPHTVAVRELRIPIGTPLQILDAASRAGLATEPLRDAVGLAAGGPAFGLRTIPLRRAWQLWEAVISRLRDPGFPIAVAEIYRPETYGVLTLTAITSSDLRDALNKVIHFWRLWTSASQWTIEPGGRGHRLIFAHAIGELGLGQRCDQEYTLAEMTAGIRQVIGDERWSPLEARLRHPRPRSVERHEAFFGAGVVFGAAQAELRVRESDLARPTVRASGMLATFFEQHSEQLLRSVQELPADVLRIKAAILEELHGRMPHLTDVASRLAIGARTLRRQLDEQGITFKALVDQTRAELAREYLERSLHSIGEIAYLLGFSEPSAFHRAFKRWTGLSPQRYRARASKSDSQQKPHA